MPFIDANGVSLHYRRLGEGPPLVLLAGMASDGASWEPVLDGLAARHELIVPDNRGSGRTVADGSSVSRERLAGDVLALLDALGIERAALLGHSMGAMLGWTIAARAPERVTALVPMAALPVATPARVELFATLARLRHGGDEADWFRLLFQFLFRPAFFTDPAVVDAAVATARAYPHKQTPEAFERQALALASFAEPLELDAVSCPVHPLCGADDLLSPPSAHLAFHSEHGDGARFPLAEPRVLENAAHSLHWERPDAVVAHVLAALDGVAGRGGHPSA